MAKRTVLRFAVFGAVYTGGEQGCKSGHLEPFSFGAAAPRV
jgi:hypothetical protein